MRLTLTVTVANYTESHALQQYLQELGFAATIVSPSNLVWQVRVVSNPETANYGSMWQELQAAERAVYEWQSLQ